MSTHFVIIEERLVMLVNIGIVETNASSGLVLIRSLFLI